MAELEAKSPCADLLPLSVGKLTLEEVDLGVLTSVTAFKGREKSVLAAMQEAHGLPAPGPGRMTTGKEARAIWFGRGQVMLCGPKPGDGLAPVAALADQSDAWACVELSGAGVEDALARLVPIDLRAPQFGVGATARTLIGHMNGSVTRVADDRFLVMVFRSMAATLIHELEETLHTIAARS